MRKRQFESAKEMIDLLSRAHESVYKVLSDSSFGRDSLEAITNLLTGCQTIAINIGNLIEESEGEGFVTVKYLEDYCELVYSINEESQANSGNDNPNKIYKKLNKMLLKIENSLKHDIPLRREAVFLPYKASMWDSLESVWEAADADPDCDAYVIPIPYFDKNPDGSVREEHYEADLFPENVPITHYSEYDFGQHHPDMIFIHNPYDYGNLVTTIHPFFYAENMKKVTDCLVYIPYFATSGGMSESRAWCPVYDYVDYIVIQHESYRKYYSPEIPEEKFLPLGSPKFDKVIQKCQNPPQLSPEWKQKISGKKVLFYNTSLSGMLDNTAQFLRKMQYVFEIFKEHPEFCLLWRPHPLFESTLYAMRPKCIEVYNALKQDFLKQEKWIYDDTPSVEDTIAICDGYIGDGGSSIVALFGVAGKRIFILDNSINCFNSNTPWARLLYSKQSKNTENDIGISYALTEENVLYKLCGEYKYEKYMDICDSVMSYAYGNIYSWNKKIIISPCLEQDIVIIDEEKHIDRIPLEQGGKAWQFSNSYFENGKLILVPHDYKALVIVDMETLEISYFYDVISFIKSVDEAGSHYGVSWVYGDHLYITDSFCNQCMRININTFRRELFDINLGIEGKNSVVLDKKNECWIIHVDGPYVTRFLFDTKEKETINLEVEGLKSAMNNKYYFDTAVKDGKYVYFSPSYANKIVKLELESKRVDELIIEGASNNYEERSFGYFINNNVLSFYNYNSGKVFELHDEHVKEYEVEFPKKSIRDDMMNFGGYRYDSRYCNIEKSHNLLNDYLREYDFYKYSRETQINEYSKINASPLGDSGEKIYKFLSNEFIK